MSGDGSAPSTRRLAAVLIADVVGYSRLMERDEAGTHARLREIRHDVTDPAVLRQGGRIVRTVGDGLLVEFPSAMSALQTAIDIQRAMAARNAGLPAAERIDHRIGINLGDILVEPSDIAGNGVNVAARLEAIAPAGGIAISGTVYEQVRQDLGVSFVDAGAQQIKNISRPVRVYTVQFDGTPAKQARPRVLPWLRRATPLVLLAIVVGAGVAYWLRNAQVGTSSALIVVPFDAGSGSEPVAASLTMQLTAAVSRISGLAVIAPTIATRFNAQTIDLRKVGRELGVRYALEGRVEGDANRVHVDAQLIAAESGATVWAGGFDAARPANGEAPLDVVGRLAETVRSEYRAAELKRLGAHETAQVLALRATADLGAAVDTREMRAVRATFEHALQLDPAEVLAQIGLADSLAFESQRMPLGSERDALLARADAVSLRATSADPNNAEAWGTRAQVLLFRDQVEAASQAVERALSLNPYVSDLHALRAQVLMARGDAADAVAEIDRALGLNPRGNATGVLLNDRCRAQLMLGRYDAAIESCERGLAFVPDWPDYMLLTAAYALKNDMPRARAAKAELMRLQPGFTIRWHAGVSGPDRARQLESTVYAGLRKAGVPE